MIGTTTISVMSDNLVKGQRSGWRNTLRASESTISYGGVICMSSTHRLGNLEVLQELLSFGADVNCCDKRDKNTALHYAASHARGKFPQVVFYYCDR